jgi:hypothetical protein
MGCVKAVVFGGKAKHLLNMFSIFGCAGALSRIRSALIWSSENFNTSF